MRYRSNVVGRLWHLIAGIMVAVCWISLPYSAAEEPEKDPHRIISADEAVEALDEAESTEWDSDSGWGRIRLAGRGLTLEAAQILGEHIGGLSLELEELPADVAKALANHLGRLRIEVDGEIEAAASEALGNHRGKLFLETANIKTFISKDLRLPGFVPSTRREREARKVAERRRDSQESRQNPSSTAATRSLDRLTPSLEPAEPGLKFGRRLPGARVTSDSLVPEGCKAILRFNVGLVNSSDVGKANMQQMLQSPAGQQTVLQLAQLQGKYGFNYLTDLQSVTLFAPLPERDPFDGILLVAAGVFQRRRIELVLEAVEKLPRELHAGAMVYEQTGQQGGGRFFFAFLSDELFVASMQRATVCDVIDRADNPAIELSEQLAAASASVPADSAVSLVMDMTTFRQADPAWQEFRDRASWFLLTADMGFNKTVMAALEAKTQDDATLLGQAITRMLEVDGPGGRALQSLPLAFRPTPDGISVRQTGKRLTATMQAGD